MEFELEQDESNPQPIPLQVQDFHIPLDYEHASYLENLDVSNFPDPVFDFSCLDDADHDEGLASFVEQDELHDYFSQVGIPAEINPSLLQPPEEHLIEPLSETLNIEPLSYEAIHQGFVPPTPSRTLHPPFLQIFHQSGQICERYLPNNEPQPFNNVYYGRTHHGPPLQEVGSIHNVPRDESMTGFIPTKPIMCQHVDLPPSRRGGRRGPLTEVQRQQRHEARLTGTCIRCWLTRRRCEGGFPCAACLAIRKPRIWRGPCTKAQFLDIVLVGSFFSHDADFYPAPAYLELVDLQKGRRYKQDDSSQLWNHNSKQKLSICSPKGAWVGFRPEFVFEGFNSLYFTCGSYQRPSKHQIQNFLSRICKDRPLSEIMSIADEPTEGGVLPWVLQLASVCSMRQITECGGNLELFGDWLWHRRCEVSLFHFLQRATSFVAEDPPKRSTQAQIDYIHSLLFVIIFGFSMQSGTNYQTEFQGYVPDDEVTDFLDRRKRVRTALWIYASIFIGKLPWGTDFWTNLPTQLQLFHKALLRRRKDKLEVLDSELQRALQNDFDRYRTARRLMVSTLRESDPFNGLEVTRTILNAHDWRQLHDSVVIPGGLLASRFESIYVSTHSRRILCPSNPIESRETARIFFGHIIDMANAPTIRHDSPFSSPAGMTLSNTVFLHGLEVFQRRIHGLSDPSGCDSCRSRWARFLDLAQSFGEAAVFLGAEEDTELLSPDRIVNMCNAQYHLSKRVLLANSVWLESSCSKLSGLSQALNQIRDPNSEVLRVRSFQRLLRRKVRSAFGPDILEPRQFSLEGKHSALLAWGLVKKAAFPFLPHTSQPLNHVEVLFRETSMISERVYEGCYAIPDGFSTSQCFSHVLEKVRSEFLYHYGQTLVSQANADFDTRVTTMERLISTVMSALYDWFQLIELDGLEGLSPPRELLIALEHLVEEPIPIAIQTTA